MRYDSTAPTNAVEAVQLLLDCKAPLRTPRTLAGSYYPSSPAVTVAEALKGEKRASKQDAAILALFRAADGARFTPSEVANLINRGREHPFLLTSVRRSLTTLTNRGLLVHHEYDRRPGPYVALQSTWGLA